MLVLFGGNGFLGSHIARIAVADGVEVVVIGTRETPAAHLPDGITYAVSGSDAYRKALSAADTIVHLAHSSKPARHADGLAYELQTNIPAINAFMTDLAVSGFSGQLFYASSGGQVYGRHAPVPALETDPALPRTAYGMGKLMSEEIVRYGARVDGLNAAVLRIANPVGIAQMGTGHGLIGAIFRALRDGVPMQLYGSGENVRDYFPADDLGRLIVQLHARNWRGDGTYNIGSGTGHTELDVFAAVRDVVGEVPEIIFKDARPFDLPYAVVDPSRARRHLGWEITQDLPGLIADLARESLPAAMLSATLPADQHDSTAP